MSLLLVFVFLGSSALADDPDIEYKIKAGYLYNFTKFITWRQDASSTFNICILDEDPFGNLIDPIESRAVGGKAIKLFRINKINNNQHCHIVYVNKLVGDAFARNNRFTAKETENTLFVGEGDFFATKLGMGFITREGKIKLTIQLQKVQQNGLQISAKLLEVAELIVENHDAQ